MAADSGGLAAVVRRKLDEGTPVEDVIQDLIARGLSKPTAQRFVERALAEHIPPAPQTPREAAPSPPSSTESRPRPSKRILAALVITGTVAAACLAFLGWSAIERRRDAQKAAAAELAAADRSRAEQIRAESTVQRDAANAARGAQHDARADEAMKQLTSPRPTAQCDAALLLGRLGAQEHVPPLLDLLNTASSNSVRNCAAAALVALGQTKAAMAAYTAWAEGAEADLRLAALTGFGDIGPSAAPVALPYLTAALKSPSMNVRYIAVDSLSKLGPTAVPLLQVAAGDADKDVRARAVGALGGKR